MILHRSFKFLSYYCCFDRVLVCSKIRPIRLGHTEKLQLQEQKHGVSNSQFIIEMVFEDNAWNNSDIK